MKICVALSFGLCTALLSGCNTIAGAGKDIERGGEKVQEAAQKARITLHDAMERAEREFRSARSRCAAGAQSEREACRARARADYNARTSEARATYQRERARVNAEEDRMAEAYASAHQQCYATGSEEDRCIAEAQTRYGY
jgi:predicted small secreted protein